MLPKCDAGEWPIPRLPRDKPWNSSDLAWALAASNDRLWLVTGTGFGERSELCRSVSRDARLGGCGSGGSSLSRFIKFDRFTGAGLGCSGAGAVEPLSERLKIPPYIGALVWGCERGKINGDCRGSLSRRRRGG